MRGRTKYIPETKTYTWLKPLLIKHSTRRYIVRLSKGLKKYRKLEANPGKRAKKKKQWDGESIGKITNKIIIHWKSMNYMMGISERFVTKDDARLMRKISKSLRTIRRLRIISRSIV